jgi:hypothetical protein
VVTSNSSPDFYTRQASDTQSPSVAYGSYERGLATIPRCTLSRRVHAPVTCSQQSENGCVMLVIHVLTDALRYTRPAMPKKPAGGSLFPALCIPCPHFTTLDHQIAFQLDHEQRITPLLNLSSDQCSYSHRIRVRGISGAWRGFQLVLPGVGTT